MRVCHFTSAHDTTDDRIFLKECQSLQQAGHEVFLVGKGEDKELSGIHIIGCGEVKRRFERLFLFSRKVYKTARRLNCEVYHFHDPELLPYGLKLKRQGKKVIFDSHEDVPAQIMDKKWIPKVLRSLVSKTYKRYETYVVKRIDIVVAATPYIAEQFNKRAEIVFTVNNYPKLNDIIFHTKPFGDREAIVCYAGGISEERGEKVMINAMKGVDGILVIAGDHQKEELEGGIQYVGRLDRNDVNELYGRAIVGLCLLKPTANYINSQPIKMYEYMAAGIPFISSDFPKWKNIEKESNAGICVNPENTKMIEESINYLLKNRNIAQKMGVNGHSYVMQNCNWKNEEIILLSLYAQLGANKKTVLIG